MKLKDKLKEYYRKVKAWIKENPKKTAAIAFFAVIVVAGCLVGVGISGGVPILVTVAVAGVTAAVTELVSLINDGLETEGMVAQRVSSADANVRAALAECQNTYEIVTDAAHTAGSANRMNEVEMSENELGYCTRERAYTVAGAPPQSSQRGSFGPS